MPAADPFDVLVDRATRGDKPALEALLPLVYGELRRLAAHYVRGERPGQTLQPTALVHEAYLRLLKDRPERWQNRAHFSAIAAHSMRQILIERARARDARSAAAASRASPSTRDCRRRPPNAPSTWSRSTRRSTRLAELEPDQARLVELRFFGGLSIEETADAMDVSPATVKRHWTVARAWLARSWSRAVSTDWARISALFDEALALERPGGRGCSRARTSHAAHRRAKCGRCCAPHETSGGFLEQPALGGRPRDCSRVGAGAPPLTGRRIGPYEVRERSRPRRHGRRLRAPRTRGSAASVALKMLPPRCSRDPVGARAAAREARAAAALSHPGIATVYALEEIDGDLFIAIELVRGSTLRPSSASGPLAPDRLLETRRRSPRRSTPRTARASCTAISSRRTCCATEDGRLKVVDFGIARDARRRRRPSAAGAHADRHAPRHARLHGARAAARPAGRRARRRLRVRRDGLRARDGIASVRRQRSGRAPRAPASPTIRRSRDPIDPPGLDAIVRTCLKGIPEDGISSGSELLQALRSLQTGPAGSRCARAARERRGGGSFTRSPSPS